MSARSRRRTRIPAMAERGYGWEKLISEMFCQEYGAESGLQRSSPGSTTCTARRHLGRRPGEGAGCDLPQGHRGEGHAARKRS